MRTITFLGVLCMFANAQANGLPTDAEILRVRCGSTCEQADPPTLQAGIKENQLGVTVEAWAFMYDQVTQTYPHLTSGAIWIIGTTASGDTFWDDPLDHRLATMEQVREFVRQHGYVKVEVGRNRRHNAKLVLPSAVPVCQRGLTDCTQVVDSMISEYNMVVQQLALVTLVHQREMDCARRNKQYDPEASECTSVPLVDVANAKPLVVNPAFPKVVSGGPTWPFWLAIIVLIVVVAIQQRIIRDRAHTLKAIAKKLGLADPYAKYWFMRRWVAKILRSHVYGYVTHAVADKVHQFSHLAELVKQALATLQAMEGETVDVAAKRVRDFILRESVNAMKAAERAEGERDVARTALVAEREAHQHTHEQAARDVATERAVRQADRDAVFHWGDQLYIVAGRLGVPTTKGYEDRLVEAIDRVVPRGQ